MIWIMDCPNAIKVVAIHENALSSILNGFQDIIL